MSAPHQSARNTLYALQEHARTAQSELQRAACDAPNDAGLSAALGDVTVAAAKLKDALLRLPVPERRRAKRLRAV